MLATIRMMAREPGAVRYGGDCIFSMGARGVDGYAVEVALANASSATPRGVDWIVSGPSPIDGSEIWIVLRVGEDQLCVSDVLL